jgi:hypothetical protein
MTELLYSTPVVNEKKSRTAMVRDSSRLKDEWRVS